MDLILVIDASFCPDTKAAGWAMFATSERGHVCCGGPISLKVMTNNIAECIAVANGLKQALAEGIVMEGDAIKCYSDSRYVRDRMRPGEVGRSARKTARKIGLPPYSRCTSRTSKKSVYDLLKKNNLTLTVTYIPGHTRKKKCGETQDWMAKVDKLSRQYMFAERNLRVTEAYL